MAHTILVLAAHHVHSLFDHHGRKSAPPGRERRGRFPQSLFFAVNLQAGRQTSNDLTLTVGLTHDHDDRLLHIGKP